MKRLKDSSDVPEARRGILPKHIQARRKKTKLHSIRPRKNGYCRLHQHESRRRESLWWIPELVCIWSASETLNTVELDTVRTSRSPSTVMTANGEVQTREEATVYVRELDLFVTVLLLEETPAVLSLGKLCEDRGYTHHWTSGQKTHLTKKCKRIDCNISCYVPFVVHGLPTSSSTTHTHTHLLLRHLHRWIRHIHRRTLYLTSADTPKIQYPKEVEVRVESFGETRCINARECVELHGYSCVPRSQISGHVNERNHVSLQSRVKRQVSTLFHIDSTGQ